MTQRHTSRLEGHQPAEEALLHQGQDDQSPAASVRDSCARGVRAFLAARTRLSIAKVRTITREYSGFTYVPSLDYVCIPLLNFMADPASHELVWRGNRFLCAPVNTAPPTDDVAAALVRILPSP